MGAPGNRTVASVAYVGLTISALLLMMALLRVYTAGLEPESRAEGLCANAGFPGESRELGLCIKDRLEDSSWFIAMPWVALGLATLAVTIASVEVLRRRTPATRDSPNP